MSTDLSNTAASLGTGNGGTMENYLEPAPLRSKMIPATKELVPVSVTPVDSKTLEGSYPGDHRGEAVKADPLTGNDMAPREVHDADGLGA